MNEIIIYRPYRVHAWTLPFTVTIGVLAFVATGYCLPYWESNIIIPAVMGVISIWLTKTLYDTSKLTVIFEQHGLRTISVRYEDYRYVLWKELLYAYYVRSIKGHLFLVLSSNALSPKEAKHFANRGANSSKICVDRVFVIYIDSFQDVSKIKELVEHYVVHVDTY